MSGRITLLWTQSSMGLFLTTPLTVGVHLVRIELTANALSVRLHQPDGLRCHLCALLESSQLSPLIRPARLPNRTRVVPPARLELACLSAADFKSAV